MSGRRSEEAVMPRAELKQIYGIGDAMCVRLSQDHGIETVAQLAALSDAEAADLQRSLQVAGRRLPGGEVARWRDQARQLAGEGPAAADEPLATFVVEVWPSAGGRGGQGGQPRYVVHHIESDQTLETSAPTPATADVFRWMQDRVNVTSAPPPEPPSEPPSEPQEAPATRGRLRITGLEVRKAGSQVINGSTAQLLATDGVALDAGSALVFAGHVSLVGAEEPVICEMRCQLQRIESEENVTFTWSGEIRPGAGMRAATISSTPVTIPAGVYRGMFFAEDKRRNSRRAFCEVPLLVVS
jgi:ribosomal protein S13